MSELMNEEERARIEAAVAGAESASGAEIVPVLLPASASYPVADARGAAFGALLGSLGGLVPGAAGLFAAEPVWTGAVGAALGALGGLALARVGFVRRALAGAELDERVDLAAAREFLAHDVFRTRDRTGILLLVSLFERRVRVLADEAVYRAVAKPAWERLAADVAREMKRNRPGEALLHAVESAGALVVEHGPRRAPGDRNELPDTPVTGE